MIKPVEFKKFYYIFPQSVALIGVKENVMPVAWHTPLSADPPLYGILISPKRFTYELLNRTDGFTVNFLEYKDARLIARTGGVSGRDCDKLKKFEIEYIQAQQVEGVILSRAYGAYECEKYAVQRYGDHLLFVGNIVQVYIKDGVVNEQGVIDEKSVAPIIYFGQDRYITIAPEKIQFIKRE